MNNIDNKHCITEISVIIPCYGAEKYLPVIVKCLKLQTFVNIKLIFLY